jgi:hypothetical protein
MRRFRETGDVEFAVRAMQAAERSRARSMVENIAFSEADKGLGADPELLAREKEIRALLNSRADKLTDLLSRGGTAEAAAELDREIAGLEDRLETIKAGLKASSPGYGPERSASVRYRRISTRCINRRFAAC